jgi:hypothetical protein
MAGIIPPNPQSANVYDDRTTQAVKSVLLEIGQILGSYRGKFAVIGGAVPWLLLNQEDMPHVGTLDVDLGLDAEALGDGEYADLVEELMRHGYNQSELTKDFQLVREVPSSEGETPIKVVVDFLMPHDAKIKKNRPVLIEDFRVLRADGADLAIDFNELVAVSGKMPDGGTNTVELAICSIPALLAMKGHAMNGRLKRKDAYDIYYCVLNYPDGINVLAEDCRPILARPSGVEGFRYIDQKFETNESYGPKSVRIFVEKSNLLGERTADQWQQDAFGQVDSLLRVLGIRTSNRPT